MSISGGLSWDDAMRPLRQVSSLALALVILYIVIAVFAVLNVVTGVFCNTAIESASADKEVATIKQARKRAAQIDQLKDIFKELDHSGSNNISLQDMEEAIDTKRLSHFLDSIGISTDDVWTFFMLLDRDENGLLDIEEFVSGCMQLNGPAKSLQLAKMSYENKLTRQAIKKLSGDTGLRKAGLGIVESRATCSVLSHPCSATPKIGKNRIAVAVPWQQEIQKLPERISRHVPKELLMEICSLEDPINWGQKAGVPTLYSTDFNGTGSAWLSTSVSEPGAMGNPGEVRGNETGEEVPESRVDRLARLQAILDQFEVTIAEANDLVVLEDYEIILILDDSGSMNMSALPAGQRSLLEEKVSRWEELKHTVHLLIDLACCFDKSGLDIFFLNRGELEGVQGSADPRLTAAFADKAAGTTPLTETLRLVAAKVAGERPILLMIFTDGEPNGGSKLFEAELTKLITKKSTNGTFKVQIMACTDDEDAVGYLNVIDKKFEAVDVTDDYYSEKQEVLVNAKKRTAFTRGDWLLKAMLGPVSNKFDGWDEKRLGRSRQTWLYEARCRNGTVLTVK
ncbi:unnamed protein product [Symbiodinium pilosum]|uniref:EF-hand domain-containing protein n=1 Tax=Symbiodinium pilosum TaxID=2952 RepID=A0A812S4Q8_SYMPI|nr:unnamed protein product [Symbiodinium pilosum]